MEKLISEPSNTDKNDNGIIIIKKKENDDNTIKKPDEQYLSLK